MSDHSQREIDDADRLRRQERDERFGEMTNEEWEARKRGMAERGRPAGRIVDGDGDVERSQADIEFLDWLCGRVPVAPDERREIEEIGKEEG